MTDFAAVRDVQNDQPHGLRLSLPAEENSPSADSAEASAVLHADSSVDFAIADEAGNKALVLYKGHIITKNFDSRVSSQETANNIRVEGTKLIIE